MNYYVSLQTISWLHGRRQDGTLEISPKFQRRAVWMEEERRALIGTIMDGLPFPEIYIQEQTDPNTGAQKHIVVDGQQRVTSILMFIDGEASLPVADAWAGEYFSDLEVPQKEEFWNYKVVVRGLRNTSDIEIRELFQRLNTNNISLNDQELRNARFKGRFKDASEKIADNPIFQSIGLFTARDIRRMLDVEFCSELLVLAIIGITNKKDFLDKSYAEFEEEFPGEPEFLAEVEAALLLVKSLIDDSNKSYIRTRSNFYSLVGACLEYHRSYSRSTFRETDLVREEITALLSSAKNNEVSNMTSQAAAYFEAVSRAASDRSRRATRHDLLVALIDEVEGSPPGTPPQHRLAPPVILAPNLEPLPPAASNVPVEGASPATSPSDAS